MLPSHALTRTRDVQAGRLPPVSDPEYGALLERIFASRLFEKSARARDLLLHLCNSSFSQTHGHVSEQDIGVAVFGRDPGYDTTTDTIARTQVSQLRKKLREYYASEGIDEPVVIEIPPGSYVPILSHREASPVPPKARFRMPMWLAGLVTAAVAIFAISRTVGAGRASGFASLDSLWGQVAANTSQIPVVVTDANLMIVADMLGRTVTLHEYRNPSYPSSLFELFPDSQQRELARHILRSYYTSVADARVVKDLESIAPRYHIQLSVVAPREFNLTTDAPENLILIGHTYGNPWIELFEARMNFHYERTPPLPRPAIVNRRPRPGEAKEYVVDWLNRGFCVASLAPKPGGTGKALLLIGTDLSSLDACGRFVTAEKWLSQLCSVLHIVPGEPLPYFEVLLQAELLASGSTDFRIVAWRGGGR
jgi:hypothetical protein